MSASRKAVVTQAELARRGVLGHAQHLRSLGQALAKAAETYLVQHKVSEGTSDWRDDFAANLDKANREFHRTLAAEAQKVADVYFGEAEPDVEGVPESDEIETKVTPTRKGGGSRSTES
jgi:hypothetical protein